jgi:hypothetical protein
VHNGRSCIGCHVQGINSFRDEVSGAIRARVDATFDLLRAENLYRGQEELDRFLVDDNRAFKEALERIEGGRSSDGEEPISRLTRQHEAPLRVSNAAAELFRDVAGLQRLISNSPDLRSQGFDQLLGPGGGIKRDTWEQGFRNLLREMEVTRVNSSLHSLPAIGLKTNSGPDATYHAGEEVVISVSASVESFVGVFSIDSRGGLRQLYPPAMGTQPQVPGNQTIRVIDPVYKSNRVFGVETVVAIASTQPIPLENESGWDSLAGSLRAWAASSAAPKRAGNQEIAVLRFLTAP